MINADLAIECFRAHLHLRFEEIRRPESLLRPLFPLVSLHGLGQNRIEPLNKCTKIEQSIKLCPHGV